MAESKKLAVTVGGQSFYLKYDQDDLYLKELAETIDHKISAMREENPALTVVKAAVLISMEILDEYNKLEADYENFKNEVEKLEF
jgi:cell division protein ZapA